MKTKHEILNDIFSNNMSDEMSVYKMLELAFDAGLNWCKSIKKAQKPSNIWEKSIQLYGLYTHQKALEVCPKGYRLPTIEEWMDLTASAYYRFDTDKQEGVLAFKDGFELRLLAAGCRYHDGTSHSLGTGGCFWSSSVSGTDARLVFFGSGSLGTGTSSRSNGFSVICVPELSEKA